MYWSRVQVINKTEIIKRGYVESTKLERSILCEADHAFVVHLRYAFQNGQKLYLVTGACLSMHTDTR
jgi:hypothetical protein